MLTGEILRISARRHPNKAAIIEGNRSLSYAELDSASNRFANAVLALKTRKGDFILAISSNVIDYPVVHFGVARSGCILAHGSPLFGRVELRYILEHTTPKLIVIDEGAQDRLQDFLSETASTVKIVVLGTPTIPGAVSLNDFWLTSPDTPPDIVLSDTDPFAMTYTGGTTGLPKGALVSHKARFISAYATAIEHGLQRDDIVGIVTPLYHVVSMLIWMQAAVFIGATCVIQRKWGVPEFEHLASKYGITSVFMVPVQLQSILTSSQICTQAYATLRQIGCGGAILSVETKSACHSKLPHVTLNDHYGQSETGLLTILNTNRDSDKLETVGQPAVGVELDILDSDGRPVKPGDVGNIVAKGEFVFSGYFNNEEENALYFKHGKGWGWTGDLGTIDSEGFLTIVGRSKEMIVSGGINVYPREVERILEEKPTVKECAVFGVPDEKWGEALVACIVPQDECLIDEAEVIRYCESHLARFKRPKHVWIAKEIPKTPSGKTRKHQLKQAFLDAQTRLTRTSH